MKYVKNAPVEFDFNAAVMFKRMFWLGASYRTGDAVIFIFEYIYKNQVRIGYAYDLTVSKLSGYNNGSHELMLGLDLGTNIAKLFLHLQRPEIVLIILFVKRNEKSRKNM